MPLQLFFIGLFIIVFIDYLGEISMRNLKEEVFESASENEIKGFNPEVRSELESYVKHKIPISIL